MKKIFILEYYVSTSINCFNSRIDKSVTSTIIKQEEEKFIVCTNGRVYYTELYKHWDIEKRDGYVYASTLEQDKDNIENRFNIIIQKAKEYFQLKYEQYKECKKLINQSKKDKIKWK